MADSSELLRLVRGITIRTRKLVNELTAGSYRSAFRGRGMEFHKVREYVEGDDLRDVDWNVTARTGTPFVKRFREERERTVYFLVDVSASTRFGSGVRRKARLAAEFCAVLALAAAGSQDRVGLIAFSDRIEHHVPPRRGSRHAMRVVRDILSLSTEDRATDISAALDRLAKAKTKRAVVFLVSDFQDAGFDKPLSAAARRHDLVAVRVVDPREKRLEKSGLIRLRDPETGRVVTADFASAGLRERFEERARLRGDEIGGLCARCNAGFLEISTDEPFAAPLRAFLEMRGRGFGK